MAVWTLDSLTFDVWDTLSCSEMVGRAWELLHRVPRACAQVCGGWSARVAWGEFIAAESMELLDGSESTSFDRSATLSF